MDDRIIIRRVQNGEVDAYALLVERHHRSLLSFIARLVQDPHLAEDIGQEVFLKVYKELPHFDPDRGTPFAAWLFIAARNRCISELRRLDRVDLVATDYFDAIAADSDSAEALLLRREKMEALRESLRDLAEPFRSTIIMSLKGASLEEIAGRCGIPQATVKTRLFRAKEKIVALLRGQLGGMDHEANV